MSSWSFPPQQAGQRRALPQVGERFGDYLLQSVIGEGASGVVFRAIDMAQRAVALKVHKSAFDAARLARFQREGEVAASLSHPGILKVLGGGVERGLAYLVYELVEDARELGDYQREQPLAERLQTLAQVAEAVGYAHAQGIVHRDLKSANVLVDGSGSARVADFGLAKGTDDAEGLTRTGALIGTPSAMAPEQLVADRDRVGPHTDVWALGVMLYEALCGRPPFTAGSLVELSARVLDTEPTRPGDVDPSIPADLDAVCLKALAKSPTDRYASGTELARDLRAHLAGQRPSASDSGWGHPSAPRARMFALSGAVLLGVAVAVAAVALSGGEARAPDARRPDAAKAPGHEPPAAPTYDPQVARDELRELREIEEPQDRIAAAQEWLERYPGHDGRQRVESQLARDLLAHPLRILKLEGAGQVYGWYEGPDRIVILGNNGILARWSTDGQLLDRRRVSRSIREYFHCTRAGDGFAFSTGGAIPVSWVRPDEVVSLGVPAGRIAGSKRWLACAIENNAVQVFDMRDGSVACDLPPHHLPVCGLAIHPTADRLVVFLGERGGLFPSGREQLVHYALPSGEELMRTQTDSDLPRTGCFTARGTLLFGTGMGEVLETDLQSGERVGAMKGNQIWRNEKLVNLPNAVHRGTVAGIVQSPDGEVVYSLGYGSVKDMNEVYAWSRKTYKALQRLHRPHQLSNMDLSADGRFLLIGTRIGTVEVWAAPR